jgi:CubicO group peptidase (beta-lactamase class C family)
MTPSIRALALILTLTLLPVTHGCAGAAGRGPTTGPRDPWGPALEGPGQVKTPGGATFAVPEGMLARQRGNQLLLQDPEGSVKVYVVELTGEDGAAAVKQAWAAVDPAFDARLERSSRPPGSERFDEVYVETYVRGERDQVAQAVARRKGQRTWVSLVRGTPPSLDRRAAQLRAFLNSLEAPGVSEADLSGRTPRPIAESRDQLLSFVRQALEATGTPGLSIAVVEGRKVVLAEGFGVRKLGRPEPVTADTLMMIGSVTKSLSTLLMATLVDAGKLNWTDLASRIYPGFKLGDAALASKLTVEQLVCACAGLPRKDLPLILEFSGKRAADVFSELALMRPSTGLRETFQYQNHMVAAGGYLAGHVAFPGAKMGQAYDRALRQRVLEPMGMTRSTLDLDAAARDPDHATPHSMDLRGKHRVVSLDHERFARYIRPSGGLWSTAREMANYVITELGRGLAPGGKRVVSEANLTHRWEPQVKISAHVHYGLGWVVARSKGLRLVTHGGGTMGFATKVSFLPDKGLGVVMIANGTGGHLAESMIWSRLMELWFGIDDKAAATLQYAVKKQKQEFAKLAQRTGEPAEAWIEPLLGEHDNPEIGKITINARAGGYVLDAGEYRTRLLRYDRPDGKRVLLFADPPLAGLELIPVTGGGGTLEMKRAQERYLFKRP